MVDRAQEDGPSWSGVTTSLLLSVIQGSVVYALFEVFRSKQSLKSCYNKKSFSKPHRTPEKPGSKIFGWIFSTLRVKDRETLQYVGLDTYLFLRFLMMGFKITSISGFFCLVVLIPFYRFGENPSSSSTGYNTYTMDNLPDNNWKLWIPLIFWVSFVSMVLYFMNLEWEEYMPLRQHFLAYGDVDAPVNYRYTLLVEEIPWEKRSKNELSKYFSKLFPGALVDAYLCIDLKELDKVLQKRDDIRNKIENLVASQEGRIPEQKIGENEIKSAGLFKRDTVCEAYCRLQDELKNLNESAALKYNETLQFLTNLNGENLSELKAIVPSKAKKMTGIVKKEKFEGNEQKFKIANEWSEIASGTGFVTFNSLTVKQSAIQCELSGVLDNMVTQSAPEPSNILWENVTMSQTIQKTLRNQANILWTLGILFWSIPVAFTQAIANLEGLREDFPWLWIPDQDSALYGLLSGYLPVILYLLLMILLPIVITLSATKFIRMKSLTEIDYYLFKWHFGFQIANLWLILIGGSIFNQLDDLLSDASGVIETIASAIPGASQFFFNILLVDTFFGLVMELSQIVPVVILFILRTIKKDEKRSQRDLNSRYDAESLVWGKLFPPIIFKLLVGLVYVCIVPVIQPVCAVYFGLAFLIYKNNALHVYGQKAEGGGAYFPLLFFYVICCLVTAETVMAVYFGIKQGGPQSTISIILIILTVLFYRRIHQKFVSFSRILCIEKARDLDENLLSEGGEVPRSVEGDLPTKLNNYDYVPLALQVGKWENEPKPYRVL